MPRTCFGQVAAEYVDNQLVTTFMMDSDGWTIVNDVDDVVAVAVAERQDIMSVGTAGFIASMERDEDDSGASTVVEVASPEDLADLRRYVWVVLFLRLLLKILYLAFLHGSRIHDSTLSCCPLVNCLIDSLSVPSTSIPSRETAFWSVKPYHPASKPKMQSSRRPSTKIGHSCMKPSTNSIP